MAKLAQHFQFTDPERLTIPELVQQLEKMYSNLAIAINRKPDIFIREDDGTPDQNYLSVGDLNVNTTTNKVEMLTSYPTQLTVTWTTLS